MAIIGNISYFQTNPNAAIKNIGRFCVESSGKKRLDASIQGSLLLLRDRVLEAPPITIGRPADPLETLGLFLRMEHAIQNARPAVLGV